MSLADDRQPIIVADAGPLIRLAAAGFAIREFIDGWMPEHPGSATVIYEDRKVASLFMEADYPVTLMTTRAFAELTARIGIHVDAVAPLEGIADQYDLKPALFAGVNPEQPPDLRPQPAPTKSILP